MDKKAIGKFAVFGIILLSVISLVILVSALTSDERQILNDEWNNYINLKGCDNLMLSIDNKILTCKNGN